ncbi:hypothetical protein [Pseudorhodobacter antarcticus]|nr:hypothetical protein [Pseudorhodobacter antarcticus]
MNRLFGLMALCCALIASSVTTAVARGDAAALSRGGITLVLCSGFGYRTVSLDARGNPIGTLHPCPDCLAGGLAAYITPGLVAGLAPVGAMSAAPALAPQQMCVRICTVAPRARGPPLVA